VYVFPFHIKLPFSVKSPLTVSLPSDPLVPGFALVPPVPVPVLVAVVLPIVTILLFIFVASIDVLMTPDINNIMITTNIANSHLDIRDGLFVKVSSRLS
jgi:hypothetical protein